MTIDRVVGGFLAGGAFGFDPTLTKASLNLTVDFPGRADVPLTGPGFKGAIIHANRIESEG